MTCAAAYRVLDAAWDLGVRVFDTAEAYGESAARLRSWIDARGRGSDVGVVTKFAVGSGPGESGTSERANSALSRFDGVGNLTLLTHGAATVSEWEAVVAVASDRGCVAGQSVYSGHEVASACALPGTGRVQAPGNVLDTRAIAARGDAPVPLDVRSVFLQGVLLEKPDRAEERVPGAMRVVGEVQAAAVAIGAELAPLLVASVLRMLRADDRVVLGVDDEAQLGVLSRVVDISDAMSDDFRVAVGSLAGDPEHEPILDPRRWPMVDAG